MRGLRDPLLFSVEQPSLDIPESDTIGVKPSHCAFRGFEDHWQGVIAVHIKGTMIRQYTRKKLRKSLGNDVPDRDML
jgi:hypothetical protein